MSKLVRITKYLSESGECARRSADELIREGKVRVNGFQVKDLNLLVKVGVDNVQVGNRSIRIPEKGVLILHKPRSVVSTLSDPEGRKSLENYLTKQQASYFPVGRLDYDSSGLLILTNDGELANRLMHPKYGFTRVYQVRVRGDITDKTLKRLVSGLKISDDEFVKAINIRIEPNPKDDEKDQKESQLTITVGEGKNRMIRRMFDAVGHPVIRLKRIKHGPLSLGNLPAGQIRKLTQTEYYTLRKKVFDNDSSHKSKIEPLGVLPILNKLKPKKPKRLRTSKRRIRD